MEKITLDKDIVEFLRAIYFGAYTDPYEAAINRAYLDMNRTIRFEGMKDQEREQIRKSVITLLKTEIVNICNAHDVNQTKYDEWHYKVCDKIRTKYREQNVVFYYGQAQKWLNMSLKYLYVIGECDFHTIFPYLHAPIDNYIYQVAWKEFGIKKPKVAWSRWDDYEEQYMAYQTSLRNNVKPLDLLRWEFKYWLKEARDVNL